MCGLYPIGWGAKGGMTNFLVHVKLNAQTKKDPFPLPFLYFILDFVVGHEMYSFMDGYSSYNQVKMAEKNKNNNIHLEMGHLCLQRYVIFVM
jgi:hypothetical protein